MKLRVRVFREGQEVDLRGLSKSQRVDLATECDSLWRLVALDHNHENADGITFRTLPEHYDQSEESQGNDLFVYAGYESECRCSDAEERLMIGEFDDAHFAITDDFPSWALEATLLYAEEDDMLRQRQAVGEWLPCFKMVFGWHKVRFDAEE
jgi:hypothetical protein